MLFDTHAHLTDDKFDEDRNRIIELLPESGIRGYVECGSDLDTSLRAAALARNYYAAFAAVGVHPHSASEWDSSASRVLASLYSDPDVVAIGEIGLDYHYDFSPRETQRAVMRSQMELAGDLGAPVVIHMRDATEDTLKILSEFPGVNGVLHCFTGSLDTMRELLAMGYYIAIGGAVTFKNAKRALEAAAAVPLDKLVLETDSPYMTPVPYRGERNTPFNVRLVAQRIAEVRNMSPEELGSATTANAAELFRIPQILVQ